ncbi:aldolase/citrate lyase family protein [Burkholderia gladioli pv. gladioli]|uniref:2,4-dihydroxyhept-2-ene-1,7-dioic acid aldolase n=1 Tax=Burkholderia gladioli TaxID=28095 RepID=A0A095F1R8_BURGA|nr:aldolase/citrate lyase family protein [Burkholderia gladioli]AJW99316.1 pyruvate kinase, barrel domain protein [Burkholderia gladioli]ASD79920.1 2,4-dihydroxyhept-2-ene-1,7-dioic acid aldolase [Burkholderia gladioli pv. gladioli]AWY54838.1 2,4-dihydroxyhept-2-ene-1,7-dioic acid aldolase [Burkholderia gladioli pv. gladioli]KGC11303.1 pyruvate kinase, barrel domain protein [Burkholderia gladioli]MDJ1164161.1 aldolase/citrate lyase family protein [Burkholderia gladioli pv. gladioli]
MSTTLKQRLANGQSVLMVNPNHVSVTLAEKLTRSGVDSIFVDCEHGAAGFDQLQLIAKAARFGGGYTIVRPQSQDRSTITRCLNCGADGVMVPLVHTADSAREVVATIRYACPDDFENRLVVVMIESMQAVENLDEILKVEGIDVFFVGPGDLSQSMGYSPNVAPGARRPQPVLDLVDRTLGRIRLAGKHAGTLVVKENVEHLVKAGAQLLYYHADPFVADGVKLMRGLSGQAV